MLLVTISLLAIFSGALGEAEDSDESEDLGFGLPDETTLTSTTSIPSITTATIPKTEIQRKCGLYNNNTCVKRSDCSTTMTSGSKLTVDLKVRSKNGCHYLEVCCHPDDMLTPINAWIPLGYVQCGIGNVGGMFMNLKGGRLETNLAEYPYMVAILDTSHRFLCNAVLIGYKVVLTTATCLAPEQPLVVRAGDWDLASDREFVPHVDLNVEHQIVHQLFNWESTKHNIALLLLTEEFPRVQHIIPICLERSGVDLDYDSCFVTGWNYRLTNKLQPTRNIVLRLDVDFEQTNFPNTSTSTDPVLVAVPRPDQPTYAKGAPLVCPTESSRYYVVGAWSTSLNGSIQFTDVRKFKEWIYREVLAYNIAL
ncbi:phenoloxidase-activating factor 2 [Drosophila erecta]|uniref:Peptidase S1 domain-containing protein n=1 Tax=Drosophila erecta TaxID=7220 RepID=B3N623_DROER|nr:phenoloxidase-activating factor 2 [Drosophila erecta]EDV58061.2 uncharacterized protein Dere_GG25177 [Drosophila erecta]